MPVVQLIAGANTLVPLEKLKVVVYLNPSKISNVEVDISAFMLSVNGKVGGDEDMVFYGQPCPGKGSVVLVSQHEGYAEFSVDLSIIPHTVEKIAFTATVHESRQCFGAFKNLAIKILNNKDQPILESNLPAEGMKETALILGELYLRKNQWKFRSIGQGFAGGLKPLAEYFGVEISETFSPSAKLIQESTKLISLSKITLDKSKPTISLDKKSGDFGEIRINLNWSRSDYSFKKSNGLLGGLFNGANQDIDLDVGCLYEMTNGEISAVQALGGNFGSFAQEPYIQLKGDDRTGAITEGEWIYINGKNWHKFKRILVYAFIYEGVANWAKTDGVVTIYVPNEPPLEVRLLEGSNSLGVCAVVLLENISGTLRVNREVRYFKGHREMDKSFNWGLRWSAGSK